jgi:hypothetical protein
MKAQAGNSITLLDMLMDISVSVEPKFSIAKAKAHYWSLYLYEYVT